MQYCFIGLESRNWQLADFAASAQTIVLNGYDTVVFKVGEGQSNLWYSDADFHARYTLFQQAGLHPIPYVFLYGNSQGSDVASEAKICNHILSLCGEICLDMESGFDGKPQDATNLVQLLSKGIIHISTWANIVDHAWVDVLKALTPISTSVWPQVYTSYLAGVWQSQYAGVTLPIYPTYAQPTFSPNPRDNFGYWELADIQKVSIMSIIRNSKGENADIALPSQFEPNETEFACGFFTVAMCKYAGLPGKGPAGIPEQVDVWADAQYDAQYGNHGPGQTGGVLPSDMWRLFKTAGNLHFWDIAAISPGSAQASDLAHVRSALNDGYLVAATVDEASVHDLDVNGGANPYSWNPQPGQATHVFLLTGPGVPGSFLLAEDTANMVGPLQGVNTVRPGPRRYDEKSIAIHWASIVQLVGPDPSHPWHKPIPSGDPTSWPQGFNAQNFGGIQPMDWPSQGMQQQAQDTWLISAKFLQAAFASTAPYTTGIALAWQERYKAGKNYGPPVCLEINSVDWSNKPIKVQLFVSGVRAEWDGSIHWFDKEGPLT